jgi:phage-related protein
MPQRPFPVVAKAAEGSARVFLRADRRFDRTIVMQHSYVKKTERAPRRELETAQHRMKEIRRANP